ncbi:MAG: lecithin retinol acyltransferase family protein [Oscillospiraceae bacterium]|nr:lecithin retinol acyltransferase family protein [Oscillospiraceae bacterium]
MDFLDRLSSGLDRLADKLDTLAGSSPSPSLSDSTYGILDKEYCWEDLDYAGKYTLQRHVVDKSCRIIDQYGSVLERGTQANLEQSMVRRAAQQAAISAAAPKSPSPTMVMPANSEISQGFPVQAQYGDIIGVVRKNGAYTHYGIYVSDTCVIHYAVPASMSVGHATIHPTSLKLFLRDATEYFILDFPKPYQPPVVLGNHTNHNETISEQVARNLQQRYGYHLYSPIETVNRAKSRIGETHYNLLTNNCEHFAIWCKTGVNESLQVSEMLNTLVNATGFQFHRPFSWR